MVSDVFSKVFFFFFFPLLSPIPLVPRSNLVRETKGGKEKKTPWERDVRPPHTPNTLLHSLTKHLTPRGTLGGGDRGPTRGNKNSFHPNPPLRVPQMSLSQMRFFFFLSLLTTRLFQDSQESTNFR